MGCEDNSVREPIQPPASLPPLPEDCPDSGRRSWDGDIGKFVYFDLKGNPLLWHDGKAWKQWATLPQELLGVFRKSNNPVFYRFITNSRSP
jgi:hypothetical protein